MWHENIERRPMMLILTLLVAYAAAVEGAPIIAGIAFVAWVYYVAIFRNAGE